MAMCEELGLVTGDQNQYDDTKIYIKVLNFDCRSVFVVVVITNLEGDRDYGQQTLATLRFRDRIFAAES